MFGRKIKKEGPIESFIGPDTFFQGTINTKGILRIDGQWEGGNLTTQGLIIGETGVAKGNITARSVIVGGKVTGNIQASEILEIHSKGEVNGDIETAHLSIAEGALFEGNCSMFREKKAEPVKGTKKIEPALSGETRQVFLPEK